MALSRFAGWQRFLSAYYLANLLIVVFYVLVRIHFEQHGPNKYSRVPSSAELLTKERQAFPLLLMALAIKFWRQQSLDSFFTDAFFYIKPMYKGPTRIQNFTPVSFKETVLESPDSGVDWLVELFAPWAPPCVHLEPVLADLSLEYTTDKLKFGRVDVSRWPAVATQFKVSTSGIAQQLPTLIMFEKGKEAARIPHLYPDGSVAKGRFRKADIVTGFNLEAKHKQATEAQPPTPKPASKKRR